MLNLVQKIITYLLYFILLILSISFVLYMGLCLYNLSRAIQLYMYYIDIYQYEYPMYHSANFLFNFIGFPFNYFDIMAYNNPIKEIRRGYWFIILYLHMPIFLILLLVLCYCIFKK